MVNYITCMGLTNSVLETINSSQISSVYLIAKQTVDDIISTYSNTIVKPISKSYIAWTEDYINNTVNKYYDSSMTHNIFFDLETTQIENESFDILLDEILNVIITQLNNFSKNGVKITIGMNKDIEYPDWEEFVISIKILPKDAPNYEEYYNLLDIIIESVTTKISSSKVQDMRILEKYGDPVIVFDVCN